MSPELERLLEEAKHRYYTEAAFHARVKLAARVEDSLTPLAPADRERRYYRMERLCAVLHALDQAEAEAAAIRYVGPPL
jgi:hypothetical protein